MGNARCTGKYKKLFFVRKSFFGKLEKIYFALSIGNFARSRRVNQQLSQNINNFIVLQLDQQSSQNVKEVFLESIRTFLGLGLESALVFFSRK